jgi:hypothetical protein
MQHQQSPPEQIAYMNGFRVPESPQMQNILKKIGTLRSPYIGMTVSGSKMDSPRMMRFAKGSLRSNNSNKNFESGSPTNDQNMHNYNFYSSSHLPGYVPPYPHNPYEEPAYQSSHPALRAALFEREQMHSRYPYRLPREPQMIAEPHGLYSLQQQL